MLKGIFFYNIRTNTEGWEHDYDTVFPLLRAHGIDGFQFSAFEIRDEGEERLLDAMKRHGMKTYVIHLGPRLLSSDRAVVEAAIEQVRSYYELFERFGCNRLMLVPGNVSDIESPEDKPRAIASMIDALRIIVADAKTHGLTVWFENIGNVKLPYATLADVKHIVDSVDGLNYILDTGNFVRTADNAHTAYEVMKDRIELIHLKNRGADFGYPPFTEGVTDIIGLMKKMSADGTTLPAVMEYDCGKSFEQIFSDSAIIDKYLG